MKWNRSHNPKLLKNICTRTYGCALFNTMRIPQLHLSPYQLSIPSTLPGELWLPSLHKTLGYHHPHLGFMIYIGHRQEMGEGLMLCKKISIFNPHYRVFKPHYKAFNITAIQCISYLRACISQTREKSLGLEISEREKAWNRSNSNPSITIQIPK